MAFGKYGSGDDELNPAAGVAVDDHGDIYVADRGNRVCLFDKAGRCVEQFIGDATISKSSMKYIWRTPRCCAAVR